MIDIRARIEQRVIPTGYKSYCKSRDIGPFNLMVLWNRGAAPTWRVCLFPAGGAHFWIDMWISGCLFSLKGKHWGRFIG